jgi:DNA topoisomerase-1
VKVLEERGIGRPSTYASIINTIQDRDYVKKIQAQVCADGDWHGGDGAAGEEFSVHLRHAVYGEAGERAGCGGRGQERWTDLLNGFYDHFEKELVVAGKNMEDIKRMEEATNEICDKCGSPLYAEVGQVWQLLFLLELLQAKPVTVAAGPWKKDPKAVTKKITKALQLSDDGEGDDWRM